MIAHFRFSSTSCYSTLLGRDNCDHKNANETRGRLLIITENSSNNLYVITLIIHQYMYDLYIYINTVRNYTNCTKKILWLMIPWDQTCYMELIISTEWFLLFIERI